jgi:hypothetical protein
MKLLPLLFAALPAMALAQDVPPVPHPDQLNAIIQLATVRSLRASKGVPLTFYAITSPALSSDDDVLTTAPAGAPK